MLRLIGSFRTHALALSRNLAGAVVNARGNVLGFCNLARHGQQALHQIIAAGAVVRTLRTHSARPGAAAALYDLTPTVPFSTTANANLTSESVVDDVAYMAKIGPPPPDPAAEGRRHVTETLDRLKQARDTSEILTVFANYYAKTTPKWLHSLVISTALIQISRQHQQSAHTLRGDTRLGVLVRAAAACKYRSLDDLAWAMKGAAHARTHESAERLSAHFVAEAQRVCA